MIQTMNSLQYRALLRKGAATAAERRIELIQSENEQIALAAIRDFEKASYFEKPNKDEVDENTMIHLGEWQRMRRKEIKKRKKKESKNDREFKKDLKYGGERPRKKKKNAS